MFRLQPGSCFAQVIVDIEIVVSKKRAFHCVSVKEFLMSRPCPTIVVDPNPLFREGLIKILEAGPYKVVSAADDVDEVCPKIACKKPALFILGADDFPNRAGSDIARLREHEPDARVVVLGAEGDVSGMCRLFEAGADGFLTKTISARALLDALALVMSDVPLAPAAALRQLRTTREANTAQTPPAAFSAVNGANLPHAQNGAMILMPPAKPALTFEPQAHFNRAVETKRLSEREFNVILYVAAGYPNKRIARELDIAEATVKVHVKAILRKLGMHNRTQAAIWAREHGLSMNPAQTPKREVGHNIILVVEDDDDVRGITETRLESLGYRVLSARSGREAIDLCKAGHSISLVFSDVVMPGGPSGYDVADWVRMNRPDIQIMLTSGYDDELAKNERNRAAKMLPKPYSRSQLATAVQELMQEQRAA